MEWVREYAAAGADEVIIRFASPDPARQMDIFEREVLAALRRLAPRAKARNRPHDPPGTHGPGPPSHPVDSMGPRT